MAKTTDTSLRNKVIYSIYVRNFTPEGTFNAIIPELERIQALGVDYIWFLPIHPIGELNRKGTLGSPYAIQDFRAINSEYGTLEDFKELVDQIHQRGMKVMIDIVFNHTSCDSILSQEHPEWFFRDSEGNFINRVPEWSDIIDLDYQHEALWDYHIDTLKQWASIVDGFRCDVAGLIPIEFWQRARAEVEDVQPDLLWLAESNHLSFIKYLRDNGVTSHSDGELYSAFDVTYDYDIYEAYHGYLAGEQLITDYINALKLQEVIYPVNYIKLRNLENHDQPRIGHFLSNPTDIMQWTAFSFFQKGITLIYNGQENMLHHTPSLFDKDTIDWSDEHRIDDYLRRLVLLHHLIPMELPYHLEADNQSNTVIASYGNQQNGMVGIFNLKQSEGSVPVNISDGSYVNLLTNSEVIIENGMFNIRQTPAIIEFI